MAGSGVNQAKPRILPKAVPLEPPDLCSNKRVNVLGGAQALPWNESFALLVAREPARCLMLTVSTDSTTARVKPRLP